MYKEIVMLLNELHRFTAWMSRSLHKAPTDRTRQRADSAFDFDPMWHGDHWQNLLSSPMDARHYVMEDWSVVADFESVPSVLAADIR
jgi:hypothetical protein